MVLVSIPVIFEIVFVAILAHLLNESDAATKKEIRAKAIVAEANTLSRLFLESSQSLSSYSITRSAIYADKYDQKTRQVAFEIKRLDVLVPPDAREFAIIDRLKRKATSGLELLQSLRPSIEESIESPVQQRQIFKQIRSLSDVLDDDLAQLSAIEREAAITANASQQSTRLHSWLLIGVTASVAIAFALAIYFARSISTRLNVVADNAMRLAQNKELQPRLVGDDEIGELDRVFHAVSTALAEAARKERAMIDNALDVICSIDENGAFTEVSPASLKAWGYDPVELRGQKVINLIPADERDRVWASLQNARETGNNQSLESRLVTKGGAMADQIWSAVWSAENRSWFCVAHDITPRKQMEKLRREFVQMITHDLRTPLTSLQMTLNLLLDGTYGSLSDRGKPRVVAAESSIERLVSLINQLLDIEKMESGKVELVLSQIEIENVVMDALEAVQGLATTQNIAITANVVAARLTADGDRLRQVLINLVANAIKFSPPGSSVSVHGHPAGNFYEIGVQDLGRGIPEQFRARIFDRFEQVDIDDSRVRGGSGLGLAICKAIVLEHGGDIGVACPSGGGSVFWFRLPLTACCQAAPAHSTLDVLDKPVS